MRNDAKSTARDAKKKKKILHDACFAFQRQQHPSRPFHSILFLLLLLIIISLPLLTLKKAMNATMLALRRSFARPRLTVGAVRHLNVHEYVSMEIMQAHGIKTPNCSVASTPEEAEQIFVHKLNKRK
jgi:hypothetical protein